MDKNPNGTAFNHVTDAKLSDELMEAKHAIDTIGRRIGQATTGRGPSYDGNDVSALARWKTYRGALESEIAWREAKTAKPAADGIPSCCSGPTEPTGYTADGDPVTSTYP